MLEHYGTHLDAPIHFPPGTIPVDKIPVKQFFGPAVVIDVQSESAKERGLLARCQRTWKRGSRATVKFRRERSCCFAPVGLRAGPM